MRTCRSRSGRAAAVLLLMLALPAAAQTTATLTGVVTDSSGAAVPSVSVTITSPALQGTRTTLTGPSGAYQFPALPPGEYRVQFARAALATVTVNVSLHVSHTARADVEMEPLTYIDINITSAPPSVLETSSVATTLPLREIDRLPLLRNQFATAQLAPGVTANTLSGGQLQIAGGAGY